MQLVQHLTGNDSLKKSRVSDKQGAESKQACTPINIKEREQGKWVLFMALPVTLQFIVEHRLADSLVGTTSPKYTTCQRA